MLDYSKLSYSMSNMINDMVEQRETNLNVDQYPYPKNPGFEWWMTRYITLYDNDANNGQMSKPSVKIVNRPSLLRFKLTGRNCDTMARSLTDYWVSQLTFGTPVYNGIISITNDAEKIFSPIRSYMCSFASANQISLPAYEHLFRFIENVVKAINWSVTENYGDSVITYTVNIS